MGSFSCGCLNSSRDPSFAVFRNETFFARNVNLFFYRYEGKFADHYKFKFEFNLREKLKLVLMWFYNLNSLGDLSSAVLRNEIFFTRDVKPFFLSIRRQISEWNLQITLNLTGLLVNKDHLILKSGKKRSEATIQILFLLLLKTNSTFNQNVHINFGFTFDGIILLWHYSKTGDTKMLCSFVLCKQYNAKSISWIFIGFS